MQKYTNWVLSLQNKTEIHNNDILDEVKFEIPSGNIFSGGWCRPQNDAPGLRAITLISYANLLLANNQGNYVNE